MYTPTRRTLLRSASLSSLFGLLPWKRAAAATVSHANPYAELGIRPLINFRGTHTTIGASKVWPEIHEAMAMASKDYVVLEELQQAVGARLAKLMGAEAALVTTGTAGAIAVGTAACLTGEDTAKIRALPDLSGAKTEVIIQKVHRNGYDHAVRSAGVRIVEVESLDDLKRAAGPQTAMLYFLGGNSHDYRVETPISLEDCLAVGRSAGFPVMVDAANMLPPWSNLQKLAALKVDLIAVSGGKHMRGPQCSGILAGRPDLIRAAWLNSNPHSDSIGRPAKVGREEIVGVWLAAEKYARLDFEAIDRESERQAAYLMKELGKVSGLQLEKTPFDRTRKVHRVRLSWDAQAARLTPAQLDQELMDGDPRIAVLRDGDGVELTAFMNEPGEEKIVARRIREIFEKHRG